jgi:hypothetical protein
MGLVGMLLTGAVLLSPRRYERVRNDLVDNERIRDLPSDKGLQPRSVGRGYVRHLSWRQAIHRSASPTDAPPPALPD